MDNNIFKIDNVSLKDLAKMLGKWRFAVCVIVFTILYFAVLTHKIPYLSFDSTTGIVGFILVGLSLSVFVVKIIKIFLWFILILIEITQRFLRKKAFRKLFRELDEYSAEILCKFYIEQSIETHYIIPPVKLVQKGIVKLCPYKKCRISAENLEIFTELFKEDSAKNN